MKNWNNRVCLFRVRIFSTNDGANNVCFKEIGTKSQIDIQGMNISQFDMLYKINLRLLLYFNEIRYKNVGMKNTIPRLQILCFADLITLIIELMKFS